jgi:hypothetical protein
MSISLMSIWAWSTKTSMRQSYSELCLIYESIYTNGMFLFVTELEGLISWRIDKRKASGSHNSSAI